jgi:hypothetical protein
MSVARPAGRDPWATSVVVLSLGAAMGLLGIVLGWRGAAARVAVADQVPYVVSGAIGGMALLVFGAGAVAIQVRRRVEATRRLELARLTFAVEGLAAVVRERTSA